MKIPAVQLYPCVIIIFLAGCNNHPQEKNALDVVRKKSLPDSQYKNTVLEEAFTKLKRGDTLSKSAIENFSKDIETRADFYGLLAGFNKEILFPKEYYSLEKASESILANWLEYPTELDTVPSKIELLKKVDYTENNTTFTYFVFQFKTEEPHWAAKDGWMMGVAGPYFKTSKPYDFTSGTFSRFIKTKETTPEKEVEWVHENVYKKNPG
jgi:hypothetical protein